MNNRWKKIVRLIKKERCCAISHSDGVTVVLDKELWGIVAFDNNQEKSTPSFIKHGGMRSKSSKVSNKMKRGVKHD